MDYKKMTIDDIIEWCKANDKVDWLKAEVAKTFPVKFIDENGNKCVDENKKRPITYVELKYNFCDEFMPEILPKKKEKKPTMWEKIAAL